MDGGIVSFLEQNSIYIVMFIVLVVWFGIFLFMNNTEKHVKEIQTEIDALASKGKEN